MQRQQVIAESVRSCAPLLTRFLQGFDDENRTRQGRETPNHAAWTLGHLAIYNHRVAEILDGVPPPISDFVTGDGTDGTPTQFDTESVSFNSVPTDDPALYPSLARCAEIFEASAERLAGAFEKADDATLDRSHSWGRQEMPMWSLAMRMVFHMGTHAGQLLDLRRALGLGSVIG